MLNYHFEGIKCYDSECNGEMVCKSIQTGNADIIAMKCNKCSRSMMIIPMEQNKEYIIRTKDIAQQ